MAISALFNISIDDLLSNEKAAKQSIDYLFESITEYDIDEPKRFDMKFGGAKKFVLSGSKSLKISLPQMHHRFLGSWTMKKTLCCL